MFVCTVTLHKLKVPFLRVNGLYFILARGHDLSKAGLYTFVDVSANDKVICRSCAGKTRSLWHPRHAFYSFTREIREILVSRVFFPSFPLRRNVFKQRQPENSLSLSLFISPSVSFITFEAATVNESIIFLLYEHLYELLSEFRNKLQYEMRQ